MRNTLLRLTCLLCLICPLWFGLPTFAQDADRPEPDPDDPGEIVREILRLQRRINDLMDLLPLETRAEVEEILESGGAPPPPRSEPEPRTATFEPSSPPPESVETEGEPTGYGSSIVVVGRDDCNLLRPFDFDEDDVISSRDRYWRYLTLWKDANGDGTPQDTELTDLYEAGIQDVSVDLASVRFADGGTGRVELGRFIRVGVDGGPFGQAPVLAVDTSRLARGTGPAILPEGSETPLRGIHPIERGWRVRWDDGREMVLRCS